jgi:hypothetical protein
MEKIKDFYNTQPKQRMVLCEPILKNKPRTNFVKSPTPIKPLISRPLNTTHTRSFSKVLNSLPTVVKQPKFDYSNNEYTRENSLKLRGLQA